MTDSKDKTGEFADRSRFRAWVLLALIVAVGLGLRLYRIDAESVCLEEHVGLDGLNTLGFVDYIQYVHQQYKTMAVLAFALEYGWAHAVSGSVAGVRMLFVLAGMGALLLVYGLTVRFYGGGREGQRAGLIAALCVALSPMQIFHSQEARQYAILALTGAAAGYTFLRVLRGGGKRWWGGNVLANLLVVATHPFGALFPLTQGLCMVAFRPGRFRYVALWFLAHAAMAGALLYWIRDMPTQAQTVFGNAGASMNVWTYTNDVLGDDAIFMAAQVWPAGRMWWFLPQHWLGPMRMAHLWLDPPMKWLFGAVLAWSAFCVIRPGRRSAGEEDRGAAVPCRRDYIFLLAWCLLPPLILALVSRWQPCNMPRYTSYGVLALYVLLGGAVARIRWGWMRKLVVLALVVLYGYQLSLVLPGPSRTDWKGVAEYIRQYGGEDDVVLIHGPMFLPIFLFNAGESAPPAAAAMDRAKLAELADFTLAACAESEGAGERSRDVWAILLLMNGPPSDFEGYAAERHLRVDLQWEFAGSRPGIVCRLAREAGAVHEPLFPEADSLDFRGFARDMAERAEHEAVKRLRRAIAYDSDVSGAPYVRLGMAFAEQGDVGVAAKAFRKAVALNPAWTTQYLDLQVLTLCDDPGGDRVAAAQKRAEAAPQDGAQWLTLGGAYFDACDYDGAQKALAKALDAGGVDPLVYLLKWHIGVRQKDDAGAQEALRAALEGDSGLRETLGPLYDALYVTHDTAAARNVLDQYRAAGAPMTFELFNRLAPSGG